jgi:acyl-CoA synthetase (AMP-forming)/AMP-acid ligase II
MVTDRIFAQAQKAPGKIVFIHNCVEWRYAEFAQAIADAHAWLSRQVLKPGAAVLCMDSLPDGWIWGLALRDLGFNTVAVMDGEGIAALGLPDIACVAVLEEESHAQSDSIRAGAWPRLPLPRIRRPASSAVPAQPRRAERPGGHFLATSGTTGGTKLIMRDALVEARTLELSSRITGISGESVVCVRDFPLWTSGGYRWPLITWNEGGTVVFHQDPDQHRPFLQYRMTHLFATPMTLGRLMFAPELRRNDDLRVLVTGGALPRAIAADCMRRFTRQVCLLFGSTESTTVGVTPVDDVDKLRWYHIHPLREVQIVDEEHRVLPPGNAGLVRIRILDGVDGYIGDEEASRAAFRDGWFYSGDLGLLGVDGRLALLGRVTETINVLGNKVAIGDIERDIQDRLQAEGVCVFSMLGMADGDEVHVAIESRRPVLQNDLQELARLHFPRLPQVRWHTVAELPRNRMGKVRRSVLIAQLSSRSR